MEPGLSAFGDLILTWVPGIPGLSGAVRLGTVPSTAVRLSRCAAYWPAVQVTNGWSVMLIWRVLRVVERRFRKHHAPQLLADVYEGRRFADGKPIIRAGEKAAA